MNSQEDFISLIQNQFPEETRSSILPHSNLRQLKGWSSLQALIITVAIDDKYGITLTDDDLRNAHTVYDLYSIIQVKSAMN